jgi:hypothetical protein
LPKGKRLEQAPGWRVIEHPRRSPWRAGYVIVPAALVVGVLQLFIASDHERDTWSGRDQAPASDVAPSTSARATSPARIAPAGRPAPTRVFIVHHAGTRNAVPAIKLAVYLEERGFAVTDIRAVDEPIERPGVRYFSEADQRDSRRLAEAIDAFFAKTPDQRRDEVVDLGHFAPERPRGKVEVWLPEPNESAS